MGYLSNEKIIEIFNSVELIQISKASNISDYNFKSGIAEYDEFLSEADFFEQSNVSRTHLLIDKKTKKLIGYMTLSADSISLSNDEKSASKMDSVPFASIPALKVGKLAISSEEEYKKKGYGSFLLEMARAHAFRMNTLGIACRFITVDADVEYNSKTVEFYEKNGFVYNKQNRRKSAYKTISMRKDIFAQELANEKATKEAV